MIDLDPASPTPLYLQIAQQLRRLIALGALKPGERLPGVRELAVRARVNRNTAARAVQHLESEGVVRTRVGQGTFVEDRPVQVDRASVESVVDKRIDRLLFEAHNLGVPLEELGWRLSRRIDHFHRARERERLASDRPAGTEDRA